MALVAALALNGCDAVGGGATIALDSAEVSVPGSVHEIALRGSGASDSLSATRIEARPGDALRFVAADRRPHAPSFVVDSLDPAVRDFLDRTGQLRGPPLVSEGAAWIVLLEGAPPGRYPFTCRSHDARGMILVTADE